MLTNNVPAKKPTGTRAASSLPRSSEYVIAARLSKITILCIYLRVFVVKWSRVVCYVYDDHGHRKRG